MTYRIEVNSSVYESGEAIQLDLGIYINISNFKRLK